MPQKSSSTPSSPAFSVLFAYFIADEEIEPREGDSSQCTQPVRDTA